MMAMFEANQFSIIDIESLRLRYAKTHLRGDVDVVRVDNAFITGDAAGLATRDLCEGIGPAIRSGQRAAASANK